MVRNSTNRIKRPVLKSVKKHILNSRIRKQTVIEEKIKLRDLPAYLNQGGIRAKNTINLKPCIEVEGVKTTNSLQKMLDKKFGKKFVVFSGETLNKKFGKKSKTKNIYIYSRKALPKKSEKRATKKFVMR